MIEADKHVMTHSLFQLYNTLPSSKVIDKPYFNFFSIFPLSKYIIIIIEGHIIPFYR